MSPAPVPPTADLVRISAHAAEQYQQRVKPALDVDAARAELQTLVAVAEVTATEPAWLHAKRPVAFYLVIGDAIALPLKPQQDEWVATTCVPAGTYTPVRRAQRSAYKSRQSAAKRAQRRARH